MTASTPSNPSDQTRAFADFAFGSQTHVADASRPLAWLSPEELDIDLSDPVQRRFGDYELIERIGQGGMGVVYRARQHGLERDVAIKLLAAGPWASEEFVARFRREARSAARMQHPNIVEIYEFGHREGLNYFSMRLVEGLSLAQRLAKNGPMPTKDAAKLLRTLAEAMDYAHRLGVLHLDLKPANVLIGQNGEPLIADFGLARRIDAGHDGGNEEISGTPSYMAPEQALLESHPLTASTDIYGLGAILYETLTGRPPFQGASAQATLERVIAETPAAPRSLRKDIPIDLEAICLKCLEKAPGQRYASARELTDDLGRFIEGWNVSVRTPGTMERLRRWAKREPKIVRMVAIDFAAALLGGAILAYMYVDATWARRDAVAQRDTAVKAEQAAKAARDRAQIASEIGAHLFAYHDDDHVKDGNNRAKDLIAWLRKRLPGDEARQADALTAFANSVEIESHDKNGELTELILAIITELGADYRHQMIKALQAGSNPYRNLYSAILAWSDPDDATSHTRYDAFMQSALRERPDDPLVWNMAFLYCPYPDEQRCRYPQTAETLVRIAPDNMYHWLLLAMHASDETRRREALHEAAKRTQFDDYLGSEYAIAGKAVDSAAVPVPPLIAQSTRVFAPNERPETSLALFAAIQAPMAAWQQLVHYCLPANLGALDPQLRADCLTVGTRMARSKGSLMSQMIGVAIVRPLAPGTPLAEEMRQLRRRYTYLSAMEQALTRGQMNSYPLTRYLQDQSSLGAMAALQRHAEFFGIPGQPPANWQPEDPNTLLSSRERRDNMTAAIDHGVALVAQSKYGDALALLAPAEAEIRKYSTGTEQWRLARFLLVMGKAQIGLGHLVVAEKNLLEAWNIVKPFGPGSSDARDCLKAIVDLYSAMASAEPDKDHSAKVAEWQRTRDEFLAADRPPEKP